MGITVATTRTAAQIAGGNQDITTGDLGGLTPKAVLFFATYCTTDGTPIVDAGFCIGAATGTGSEEEWAFAVSSEDGQGTTDTTRSGQESCILLLNVGLTTKFGEATFVSFVTNGVRVNWSTAPASAFLITATFFAGSDLDAQAGIITMGANVNDTTTLTPNIASDVILFSTVGRTFPDAGDWAALSYGFAINKSPVQQGCWNWASRNAVAAADVEAVLYDHYALGETRNGSTIWAGEVSNFTATQFTVTTKEGASGSDEAGYLAIAFNGEVDFESIIMDTPTAGGNDTQAGITITPQAVLLGMSYCQAVDTVVQTGDGGSIGSSVFTESAEYSNSIQDEDGEATTDTQSLSNDQAVDLPQDDASVGFTASFVSFGSFTLNFTNTLGTARKWWVLAIEEYVAPAPSGISVATPGTYFAPRSQAAYSLWLKSPAGQTLQIIDDFIFLELVRVTNDVGSLKVVVEKARLLDEFVVTDGIIEVWRKLAGTKRAYLEGDTQWRIRKNRETSTQTGIELEIIALDNVDILNRGIIAYYTGSAYTSKSDAAGTVMREFVYENLDETGAADVNRFDTGGFSSTYFQVEADRALGETISINDAIGRTVLSQLQKAANQSKELGTYMFFDVVVVDGNLLEFRTYENQRGNDHGADSGQEIVLGEQFGTLQNAVRTVDYTRSYSVAYTLGAGEQDDRLYGVDSDAVLIALSPFGRIEKSFDVRQVKTQSVLDDAADEYLRDGQQKTIINGELVDGALRYGVDYYFGDRILIRFGEQTYTARVNGIKITVANGQENIRAALEVET